MELLSSLKPLMFTAAIVILLTPIGQELIPCVVKNYLVSICGKYLFTPQLSLLIEEKCDISSNQIYEAAATYLRSKIGDSSNLNHLRVSKTSRQQGLTADIVIGQSVMDSFQDINWLKWKLCAKKKNKDGDVLLTYFELSFEKKFKEVMLNSYLPHVISCSKVIQEARRVVKLYSCDIDGVQTGREWYSIIIEHPATFEKLAMDPETKRRLIDDLDRFVKRKEWYKKVGRAWKRQYNLDISSLISIIWTFQE